MRAVRRHAAIDRHCGARFDTMFYQPVPGRFRAVGTTAATVRRRRAASSGWCVSRMPSGNDVSDCGNVGEPIRRPREPIRFGMA
jgi:hypothetical protein